MLDRERSAIRDLHLGWIDLIWLVFLGGLALLPPVNEIHKQLILLAIFVVQLLEGWLVAQLPKRGPAYSVLLKILLATLLLDHTGEIGINSSYYPNLLPSGGERRDLLRHVRRDGLDHRRIARLPVALVPGTAGSGYDA